MTLVPGRPHAVPDLRRLAELGANDHSLWARAIEIWHNRVPSYRPGFVHRDYHPGNILWSRAVGHVVDWANACAGPWGCDIAHCRDNLLDLAGREAADSFLALYIDVTGATYDPYWEIASVLEHSPSGFTRERTSLCETRLRPAVAAYAA